MKQLGSYIILFSAFVYLMSCTKAGQTQFDPYNNNEQNDTAWVSAPVINDVTAPVYTDIILPPVNDSLSANLGKIVKLFNDSLQIEVPPNSFIRPNTPYLINGPVKIEVLVLRKRGDFIRFAKSGHALNLSNNKTTLLDIVAMLHLRVTQNGQPVALHPNNKIAIKLRSPQIFGKIFTYQGGAIKRSSDSAFYWFNPYETDVWSETLQGGTNRFLGYMIESPRTFWMCLAIDNPDSATQPKNRVNAIFNSLNFTNKNTNVYLITNGRRSVVNLTADAKNKLFYADDIPKNASVNLVSISKINGEYYLGVSGSIIAANANLLKISPQKVTLKALRDYLTLLN